MALSKLAFLLPSDLPGVSLSAPQVFLLPSPPLITTTNEELSLIVRLELVPKCPFFLS